MKILVIFTGGTIGSSIKDGWISTDSATKYALIEKYKENFGADISFETTEPYFLLSENLNANTLNLLIASVESATEKDYDGIIITHGTDTLHFSAAAVQLAFQNAKTPIVFVSANYPLENDLSNGHANFEGAVSLIKSSIKTGVYISYKNTDSNHFIHTADKALSFSENDDSIYSLRGKPFAVYKNGEAVIQNRASKTDTDYKTVFCENPNILVVSTTPGDSFSYDVSKYNAVVLRPYHSGTLNTVSPDFLSFLSRAAEDNIPVFLANAPSGTTYETVKKYENSGIIPLPNISFAYAYMKLWAGISESKDLKNLF